MVLLTPLSWLASCSNVLHKESPVVIYMREKGMTVEYTEQSLPTVGVKQLW